MINNWYLEDLTQEEKILNLLKRNANKWVPVHWIIRLGIAQYNARIFWLRKKGYQIFNKTKIVKKGFIFKKIKKISFYMLTN